MKEKVLFFLFLFIPLLLVSCVEEEKKFYIGVSQCADDPWREHMNKELHREVNFNDNVRLKILSSQGSNKQQIKDINTLVSEGIDLLVVSPNEADAITPIVEEVYDRGIPVIIVDRKINSDKYSAFIGADNREVGREVARYIIRRLDGHGKVLEIAGTKKSTPSIERHEGFVSVMSKYKDIELLPELYCDWSYGGAKRMVDSLYSDDYDIDIVFAHNDMMAFGAYDALYATRQSSMPLFVGIDALPGKGLGIDWVNDRKLEASFMYPTGGETIIKVAMAILENKPYLKEITLPTALVDEFNARVMNLQADQIALLDQKIKILDVKSNDYFSRYVFQRILFFLTLALLILTILLLFYAIRAFWVKKKLTEKLEMQRDEIQMDRDKIMELSEKVNEEAKAKMLFFTHVSHDIRTPLTLISDPVDELMRNASLDERHRNMLLVVRKNVYRLLRLVNDVLDFRKMDEGDFSVNNQPFDIKRLVYDCKDAFKSLSVKHNINLEIICSDENNYISFDFVVMERIIFNLLSNAFRYTPDNGKISIKYEVKPNADGLYELYMDITDTGGGVDEKDIPYVFNLFYRAEVESTNGTGIGLAVVKGFIDKVGGRIWIESTKGKGTSVKFVVPVEIVKDKSLLRNVSVDDMYLKSEVGIIDEADLPVGEQFNYKSSQPVILVADDNDDIREYIKVVLSDEYFVLTAKDGAEAYRKALQYLPDMIICDVMMPVMDGFTCCRKIKSEMRTSHIPVMLLTAKNQDVHRVEGFKCGADSYVIKPFNSEILLIRVRNIIDNRKRVLKSFSEEMFSLKNENVCDIDKDFLSRFKDLLDKNYSDSELNVERMCEMMAMSRVQLYRKVKSLTNFSPNELLRIKRLKRASHLLASTGMSISEISYTVGFTSPSYFAKCYKEYFGETPRSLVRRKEGIE